MDFDVDMLIGSSVRAAVAVEKRDGMHHGHGMETVNDQVSEWMINAVAVLDISSSLFADVYCTSLL